MTEDPVLMEGLGDSCKHRGFMMIVHGHQNFNEVIIVVRLFPGDYDLYIEEIPDTVT